MTWSWLRRLFGFGRSSTPLRINGPCPDIWVGPAPACTDWDVYMYPLPYDGIAQPDKTVQIAAPNLTLEQEDAGTRALAGPNTWERIAPGCPHMYAIELPAIQTADPNDVPITRARGVAIATRLKDRPPSHVVIDMSQIIDGSLTWPVNAVAGVVFMWVQQVAAAGLDRAAFGVAWPWNADVTRLAQFCEYAKPAFVHLIPDWWVARRDELRYTSLLLQNIATVRACGAQVGIINWCHGETDAACLHDLREQFNWFARAFHERPWPDRLIIESWGSDTNRGVPSLGTLLQHAREVEGRFTEAPKAVTSMEKASSIS